MAYRVQFSETAAIEMERAFDWIAAQAPDTAVDWFIRLRESIQSLEDFPERCPLAPESELAGRQIRQRIFGNYRILYMIERATVTVLHVRHAARDTMSDI